MVSPQLRLCLVDMNNGVPNQATRSFKRLYSHFTEQVQAANPGLDVTLQHVQPRNLGELPADDIDLTLSSGGPGAPSDGWDEPWCNGYRAFLDRVVERNLAKQPDAPQVFVVCHSFELTVTHFRVATMKKRETLKFGVFPAYVTKDGEQSVIFQPFADRLFTWEHRRWEAVELDAARLAALGGAVLATESREGKDDKGDGLMGFRFAPGVVGTQFHPEADRPGVMAWITQPQHTEAVKEAYGPHLLERMMKTLKDPSRLARTYALCIPGWLSERFNAMAPARGWNPIGPPHEEMSFFEDEPAPRVAAG